MINLSSWAGGHIAEQAREAPERLSAAFQTAWLSRGYTQCHHRQDLTGGGAAPGRAAGGPRAIPLPDITLSAA